MKITQDELDRSIKIIKNCSGGLCGLIADNGELGFLSETLRDALGEKIDMLPARGDIVFSPYKWPPSDRKSRMEWFRKTAEPYLEDRSGSKVGIKDLPEEIVEKMLERQVEQGNKRDISVFENNIACGRFDGGFTWIDSKEGGLFWDGVLTFKNFGRFFEKYPKTQLPRWMEVRQNGRENWVKRKVVFIKNGRAIAWRDATTDEEVYEASTLVYWKEYREIEGTITFTKKEIADKIGLGVDDFKIEGCDD